ncbi:DEAD/DEAH box helicase family protein [Microbacterium sp.]|uniref:DEAD/DEAH box helicase family protein n=1 Tax=Microbacterium sp. TaxID=51671 RepID=UPI003A8C35FF
MVSPDVTGEAARPLASWRFTGDLRHYQADVLERVVPDGDDRVHIVAPPGSGKTLLGLLLAARRGARTLVLAPTTTIRAQWADTAASLVPDGAAAVSDDPGSPGDLTVLTYQLLSVLDGANPLEELARTRWREELEETGRSAADADQWLRELAAGNRPAYRAGIVRRSRALRRALVRQDPASLEGVLHPNARAAVAALVAHGVETIVLDECHHLLDHWAMVVAALVTRLRDAGRRPLVIGLTATLPSPDDADEYDNYTSLLGEVDYEVPTPAVVREGNLAPYRDLVHFVEPPPDELAFLRDRADALSVLIRTTFARDAGLEFLLSELQPELPSSDADPLTPPPADDGGDARLQRAFTEDFAGAEVIAAMLATVAPDHPLVALLPSAARRTPTADEGMRTLSRFALNHVLPDPRRRPQWERIRRSLADFGYTLTDRGVRRSRDAVDTMLASSRAKDHGACDIIASERAALGDDLLRVLVVTDFVRHGNRQGGLVDGAGALRTFDVIATDTATRDLPAVLVTGTTVRVATEHAGDVVRALGREVGTSVAAAPRLERASISEVHAPGVTTADLVRAVSELLRRGVVRIVVGTRGLFGEGWDCPSVNTLVDLTAVATAAATQQLRGRTLRLDSAWPEKVAHNWTVTALLPAGFPLDADPDARRLRRKHSRLWGLDRDDPDRVVRGLGIALTRSARELVRRSSRADAGVSAGALNEAVAADVASRVDTYQSWRVGTAYRDDERTSVVLLRPAGAAVFRTSTSVAHTLTTATTLLGAVAAGGATLATVAPDPAVLGVGVAVGALGALGAVALSGPTRRARRQTARAGRGYRDVAAVVWEGLRAAGRVRDLEAPEVVVRAANADGRVEWTVGCPDVDLADQRTLADALTDLFGPVRTPRFLLGVGRSAGSAWSELVLRAGRASDEQFLPVPSAIGRRRADAVAFAERWRRDVGPCILHPVDGPEATELLARARRDEAPAPVTRTEWL